MKTSNVILGNDRRMLTVEFLKLHKGSADLRDLVEFIAEREGKTDRKHRKSIYVSLVQTHIPKLEREGVIKFQSGTLTLLKVPSDVSVYMEVVKRRDISWSTFYMVVSLMFISLGLFLENHHLVLASFLYLSVAIVHHLKIRRVL
ncbi:MAG: hypothetical protein GXO14_01925 [Thermococci archaeon]|nr:hypothetical protein [Thermococci archaeon]